MTSFPNPAPWVLVLIAVAGAAVLLWGVIVLVTGLARRQRQVGRLDRDAEVEGLRAQAEGERAERQRSQDSAIARELDLKTQLADGLAELGQERQRAERAVAQVAGLAAQLETVKSAAVERETLLTASQQSVREEFSRLSGELLQQRSEEFATRNEQRLGEVLTPLREQLASFRERIDATHSAEQLQRGALAQQIAQLTSAHGNLNDEAQKLSRALRGDSKVQGGWGELVLQRALEVAGLGEREFQMQVSLKSDDGARLQPDVVLRLPGGRGIVIDAKVSLTAFERAMSADDPTEQQKHLGEHRASLKRHIDQLGGKAYDRLLGESGIDFVFLFVPIEAAYSEALRHGDLLSDAIASKRVALVGPSNLMATLKMVSHLWKMEDRTQNADEIARQAGSLYDGFALLEKSLSDVERHFDRARASFSTSLQRLSSGRNNLLGRVEKLRMLGANARKELPVKLVREALETLDQPDQLADRFAASQADGAPEAAPASGTVDDPPGPSARAASGGDEDPSRVSPQIR